MQVNFYVLLTYGTIQPHSGLIFNHYIFIISLPDLTTDQLKFRRKRFHILQGNFQGTQMKIYKIHYTTES